MKRIISFSLLLFALLPNVFAEYSAFFAELEITTHSNKIINGHIYIVNAYFDEDSAENSDYLIKVLDQRDYKKDDTITYFKTLISYAVSMSNSEEFYYHCTTLNPKKIATSHVKEVKILSRIDYGYLNSLRILGDKNNFDWIYESAIQRVEMHGYLCEYTLYIHQDSPKISAAKAAYKKLEAAFKKNEAQLNEQLNMSGMHDQAVEQLHDLEEQRDEDVSKIIDTLEGEKIVLLTFCSC